LTYGGNAHDLLAAAQGLGVNVTQTGDGEWVSTQAADSAVVISPRTIPGDQLGLVPNVLGMGLKDALYILENKGLKVRIVGHGMVKRQSLPPGTRCFQGSSIVLELT
jgi:cell division protein FtsI (penicillin-binding protein 3)